MSAASNGDCGQPPQVELFKKGPFGLAPAATLSLAAHPDEERLAPRSGGFWYFMASAQGVGTYAYALDEEGAPLGEPWHDDYTYGYFTPHLRGWRDGFVGGHRESGVVSMLVSDGVNRTDMGPIPGTETTQVINIEAELALAVGGPEDGSFLLAYATVSGILLARADCVTPFE